MQDVMGPQGKGTFEITPAHEANVAIKKKFVDALFANDVETMRACVTDDVTLLEPEALPFGGTYVGIDAFLELWASIPKVSHVAKSIQTLHTYLTANPDHLFVELDFKGTRLDNGEEIASIVMEKFEFRGGLISAIIVYWFNIPHDLKKR